MFFIFLGTAAGVVAAFGSFRLFDWPSAHLSAAFSSLSEQATSAVMAANALHHPELAGILKALAAALIPAVLAAVIMLSARAVGKAKKVLGLAGAAGAVCAFFFLPFAAAVVLAAFCILVAVSAFVAAGVASGITAFCGAYLSASMVLSVWRHHAQASVTSSAQTLAHYSHLSLGEMQWLLSAAIVAICATGLLRALFGSRGD